MLKPIKINKNSWHYHVATTYTDGDIDCVDSICGYNKKLLYGIIAILLMTFVSSLLICMLLVPFFYGILYLIYGLPIDLYNSPEGMAIVFGLMCHFCIIIIYFSFLYDRWLEYQRHKIRTDGLDLGRKDSYIKAAWKSFKDKICVKIEISD